MNIFKKTVYVVVRTAPNNDILFIVGMFKSLHKAEKLAKEYEGDPTERGIRIECHNLQ
jgi:hypothetical protein